MAPEEKTDQRDRRASLVPLGKPDLSEQPERRENLVFLDCLATLEDKAPRDPLDS